jgi:hypothetical protein
VTLSKWKPNPMAKGAPMGVKAAGAITALAATRRANDRRVKCAHCDLLILPANMARHVEINHEEDDDAAA